MAYPLISVICRGSAIDSRTNVLSLFEITEEVQVQLASDDAGQGAKVAPYELHIVHLVTRDDLSTPEQFQMRCRIVGPSGLELTSGVPTPIDLTEKLRFRVIAQMFGLPFERSGVHQFVFEHAPKDGSSWREVARFPMLIHVTSSSGADFGGAAGV